MLQRYEKSRLVILQAAPFIHVILCKRLHSISCAQPLPHWNYINRYIIYYDLALRIPSNNNTTILVIGLKKLN